MLLAELVSWGFLSPCDFLCTSKGWGFGYIRDSNGRACKFGVNCNASVIDSLVCGVLTPYKIRKRYLRELFIDKFLYNTLTSRDVPHFAIFLNDVQRAGKIESTWRCVLLRSATGNVWRSLIEKSNKQTGHFTGWRYMAIHLTWSQKLCVKTLV